jgi:hypothetical protein
MTRAEAEKLWNEMGWEKVPPSLITAALVFYHRGHREGIDEMIEKIFAKKGDNDD